MANFRTLEEGNFAGKRVLVRVDLNVPMKGGKVTDLTRIHAAAPTINDIAKAGGKVILLAHFGRPDGKRVPEMSLEPVRQAIADVIGRPVGFASDCIGDAAKAEIAKMKNGDVLMLENTRYHAGEEKNEAAFTKALAELGDVYVNDAFSTAHRAHSSTEGLARHLPSYAGRSMEKELTALGAALGGEPKRPVVAVVGGAKVSSKIDLLENLIKKVDILVIGGGMANTFLLAQGLDMGKSLAEPGLVDTAKRIMAAAKDSGCEIVLPVDAVVSRKFEANPPTETVAVTAVPADAMILDVGPASIELVAKAFDRANTLVWNGPLGAFEMTPFDRATVAAARHAAARTTAGKLLSVAGGGDTVAALNHAGVVDRFSYVSTAGGAFLEWLEGKALPGVEALKA
ncbi:MAG: phosphoglycerate kinase [Bauldia sp.]|nr:phosphoglycerate kinase [Bauldia sp.]